MSAKPCCCTVRSQYLFLKKKQTKTKTIIETMSAFSPAALHGMAPCTLPSV